MKKGLVVNMHEGAGLGRDLGTWAFSAEKTQLYPRRRLGPECPLHVLIPGIHSREYA